MIASYEIRAPGALGWIETISPVSEAYVARQWGVFKQMHPDTRAILYAPDGSVIARHNVKRDA